MSNPAVRKLRQQRRKEFAMLLRQPGLFACIIVILIILVIFCIWPILRLLLATITNQEGHLDLSNVQHIISSTNFFTSLRNSMVLGFCVSVISTIIVLVTGEFMPKTLFKLNPNRALTLCSPLAYLFYILLYPISKCTSGLSKLLLRIFGVRISPTDTDRAFTKVDLDYLIQSTIDNSSDQNEITDEVKIFQNALDFSNCKVRDCIVPRTEIVAVDIKENLDILRARFVESGCSKLIVFDGDVDNILGFIHSSEMFRLKNGDNWTKHIREVPIVPETMTAQKLMRMLMQQKKSVAVVVDEFGGTSGICTLEDLVEEIFGDIQDEHDQSQYIARKLPDGDFELSARLEIERANELLGIDLPESDDYITVGGFILNAIQRFPKLNEVLTIGNFEFKVLKNTSTKIELVRLHLKEK